MSRAVFFEAANQLLGATQTLNLKAKAMLGEAEDLLCGEQEPTPNAPPAMGVLFLVLRGINEKITEVMAAQDRLYEAAGKSGPFALTLGLCDEDRPEVRRKIRELLSQPAAPADGSSVPANPEAHDASGSPAAPAIRFEMFPKLKEALVAEKAMEVYAPLRGEPDMVLLRLEALRQPDGSGYEVAVYRQDTITIDTPEGEAEPPLPTKRERSIWTDYDTIRSDRATADLALEQVLGFLELRCALHQAAPELG